MLRRRIMLAQGGVSLPAGYTKIEYLESDGSQFVDTGYKPNNNTRVVMEASLLQLDGDQYFYGAKDSGSTQSFVGAYSDGAVTFGYANSFPSAAFDLQIEEKILIDQNREKGLVNGELVATANTATFQTPCTLYLCARNNDGEASKVTKARIYSCKIYDNGVKVRDYVPCTNPIGVKGLWDKVNEEFYALTPTGYTRLAYLESDGSDYIDTGFKPNQDTRVVMDVQLLTANPTIHQGVFGARSGNTNQLWVLYHYTENAWAFRFGNNSTNHYISAGAADRVTIDVNANTMTIGDTSVTAAAATFTSAYTMWLLAFNNAGTPEYPSGPARIYSCQIYDNGTLVRDFIPAMNASGEAGLYDLKNDVWYALKPVVTKTENKITFDYYYSKSEHPITGVIIFKTVITIYSTYAITSDLDITFEGSNPNNPTETFKMLKGTTQRTYGGLSLFGIPTLISISPTEDDTYIYAF